MNPVRSAVFVVVISLITAAPGLAQNVVFVNGFESGGLCRWSGQLCDLNGVLEDLGSAATEEEITEAITAAFEVTAEAGWITPEHAAGIAEVADFMATYEVGSYDFLSIESAHRLALAGLNGPTLAEAITALTTDVQAALVDPDAESSRRVLLMFNANASLVSPLPLTAESKLTVAGSMLYGQWLLDTFPEEAFSFVGSSSKVSVSSTTCTVMVRGEQAGAIAQVVTRNVMVLIYRMVMAVMNIGEAVVNCFSGGTAEAVGVILDAVQGCVTDPLADWVEVESEASCIFDTPEERLGWLVDSSVGCLAGAIPCIGDGWSIATQGTGVVSAAENMVNGICTISANYGVVAGECVSCADEVFDLKPACGGSFSFKSYAACFDPVNAVPTVTCASVGEELTVTLPGGVPLVLVRIPAGTFMMGSPTDERGRLDREDLHQVTLTQDYYLGKYEVTQRQWQAVMGSNPSYFSACGLVCPVERVSWNDICGGATGSTCASESFIGRLNAHMGTTKFRLPTEAEWERAVRAGTQTRFSHGDVLECGDTCETCTVHDQYMWWCGNSVSATHPVGSKQPNGYGLYDMHGNVWEWVADWYTQYLGTSSVTDPTGPTSGSHRVVRGGGWYAGAQSCRSAFRYYNYSSSTEGHIGFRLARSP